MAREEAAARRAAQRVRRRVAQRERANSLAIKNLIQLVEKIPSDVHESALDTVLKIFERIVHNSPVKLGWYRLNNRIVFNVNPPQDTVGDPKTVKPSDSANVVQMAATSLPTGDIKFVVFFNNVPYARRIEFGHSKFAPLGVYTISVQEVESFLTDSLREAGLL